MTGTFDSYNRIRAKFVYSELFERPGASARYFYRCFVLGDTKFCAETARTEKLFAEETTFVEWIRSLEAYGFVRVVWATPFRYTRIDEGPSLHKDFNQERMATCEMAKASTVRDIDARLGKMERGFERIAAFLKIPCDPPDYNEFYKALSDKEGVPF